MLTKFLTKLSIGDLGKHLSNIANLYVKPIKTWKKIISYRNESYDFYLLFIIYYAVIIYFLIENSKLVIPITALEILITLVPFSFLYLPFVFFKKKWNKKINSNRLFRLIFILKIQFTIIIIPLILFAKWSEMEGIYIIYDNFIWVLFSLFIIVFPLLLNLKLKQKILWIFTNYIFSLVFIFLLSIFFIKSKNSDLIGKKITLKTPTFENLYFDFEYNYSHLRLDEKYYIALLNVNENDEGVYLRNTQFGKPKLISELMEIQISNLKNKVKGLDSLVENSEIKIKTSYLDSLRLDFNKTFYRDLKLTDSLQRNSTFNSNKKYYQLINSHLSYYDSIYQSKIAIENIIKTEPEFLIRTEENNFVAIFEFSDENIINRKKEIETIRENFIWREKKTNFMQKFYTFPIELIINDL